MTSCSWNNVQNGLIHLLASKNSNLFSTPEVTLWSAAFGKFEGVIFPMSNSLARDSSFASDNQNIESMALYSKDALK